MSVIFFASVIRVRDGLPLSASTDYEHNVGVQESKKCVKRISKKLDQFPDRCMLKNGSHTIKAVNYRAVIDWLFPHMETKLLPPLVTIVIGAFFENDYTFNLGIELPICGKETSIFSLQWPELTQYYLIIRACFISSLGVGYIMLCTENYPTVLAFCFLDELQKEFITTYDTARINTAIRPYSFIEFDNCIQKAKQRYNNPRSLSTKINLADMQTEIKLRPPYQISMCELGAANGFSHKSTTEYKAPHQRLEPVTLAGIISFLLSLLCGALNLIRGFHAIESLVQIEEDNDFSCVIAFFLGTAACLYQCYLYTYCTSWRNAKSYLAFGLVCLCNMYLYELRNLWQIFFHVTVGAITTLQIRLRQPELKCPDYNV